MELANLRYRASTSWVVDNDEDGPRSSARVCTQGICIFTSTDGITRPNDPAACAVVEGK